MVNAALTRQRLRPHGIVAPGCRHCYWFKDCGGAQTAWSMQTCFEATCCEFTGRDKALCNSVCPYKPDFPEWLSETHGLSFDDLPSVVQPALDLPHYIPVIDHAYRRQAALDWPVVALNTSSILRVRRKTGGEYRALADCPTGLRESLRIAPQSRVILNGIGKDKHLERYWENRLVSNAPAQLARLGIDGVIGPNFSHLLGVPRTDNLFNRLRQLICLGEMRTADLSVIPHLNAVMPEDWRFWRSFLSHNSSIRYVAVEFQTGNGSPAQGKLAIENLVQIQTALCRPLHPLIVGGGQFVEYIATRFANFTLMDSMPFAKAMRRQHFDRSAAKYPWTPGFKLVGQNVDDYLLENIRGYSALVKERIEAARKLSLSQNIDFRSNGEKIAANT